MKIHFWLRTLPLVAVGSLGLWLGSEGRPPGTVFGAATQGSSAEANIFVGLAKKAVPSVVNISTMATVKSSYNRNGPEDTFRRFFEDFFRQHGGGGNPDDGDDSDDDSGGGLPPGPSGPKGQPGQKNRPRAMSLGSGFIIDASGLIMTNNHVVADADEIKIQFTEDLDEKPSDGEVVGRDPELDLALIRVKTKRELVPAVLGDSDTLEVGEYVMAVGNPFGQGHSVTHGIISAKEREAPDFQLAKYLQTDAPINPGNSGGPLLNLRGEVIGINNAIDQRAQGIGFAIPINLVKKVLPQLRTKGTVARGYIGVLVGELTPELAPKLGAPVDLRAPFINHVYPGEPADKAGVKTYDVILEFNGKAVHSSSDLIGAVTSVGVNQSVPIKVLRNGEEKNLSIKVMERPGILASGDKESKGGKKGRKKKSAPHLDSGMDLEELTPEILKELGVSGKMTGVLVSNVAYEGAADRAGLMRGDIIIEVDRKPIKDVDGFYAVVKAKKSYLVRVRRLDPQGREAFSVIILDLKE